MNELDDLLQAVLDAPDDDAPRRAYADRLIAQGDPRGELIHVQCDLAQGTRPVDEAVTLRRRELALLAKNEKSWIAPFDPIRHVTFRRGMIEHAYAGPKLDGIEPLFAREPVTSLSVRGATASVASTLAARPELSQLRALRVAESKLKTAATALLRSPSLRGLRELDLSRAGVDDRALESVKSASVWAGLESLVLYGNPISTTALAAFLDEASLGRLRSLGLSWIASGSFGAANVRQRVSVLPSLEALDLSCNDYSDDHAEVLALGLARIKRLSLTQNRIGARGVEHLGALAQLEELSLSTNPLGLAGAEALASQPWSALRRIDLMQTSLGDEGIEVLAARDAFPRLAEAKLTYLHLTARAGAALASVSWPLEHLDLWANQLGDAGASALAAAPWRRSIRKLVLAHNAIGDAGVIALAQGEWPRLEYLHLRGNRIGDEAARALAASTGLPSLVELQLEQTGAPKKEMKALRARLGAGLIVS